MSGKVNVFHAGPQKTGTTWIYRALKEHAQVSAPDIDAVHYFDMNFDLGTDWYERHWAEGPRKCVFDPTYTYCRDPKAPSRIFQYNPNAKIMITARNPIERAFSHYWHEKKKDRFNFRFEEALDNYDLYANWIEPGFYALHYKRFLDVFPENQVQIFFFDDFLSDPHSFVRSIYSFCDIEERFTPSIIDQKVNEAGGFKSSNRRRLESRAQHLPLGRFLLRLSNFLFGRGVKETLADVDESTVTRFQNIFLEDILELERLTHRNLDGWK